MALSSFAMHEYTAETLHTLECFTRDLRGLECVQRTVHSVPFFFYLCKDKDYYLIYYVVYKCIIVVSSDKGGQADQLGIVAMETFMSICQGQVSCQLTKDWPDTSSLPGCCQI